MAGFPRAFIVTGVVAAFCSCGTAAAPTSRPATRQPINILFITADDMNYDSLGVTGCPVPAITPNLDRLAAEGMRFEHAHVTIAVCQPSRSVLMTGRYPHRNGAMGFDPIDPATPTLTESLREAGYLNGIIGKHYHLQPEVKFCWDRVVTRHGNGRDPQKYYEHSRAFFEEARSRGRPFFWMANSQDPHRPFAGSADERRSAARRQRDNIFYPDPGRIYTPEEIVVPGFLPDLPDVRTEIAQYYSSAHRCDETVGAVLRALRDAGAEDNTLVMFLSDNGMALPFAKTNCYLNSTQTPWIVRWPGRVRPGTIDREHFISGIDYMPTILEAAGLPKVPGMDGRSFLPLLRGDPQEGRDHVFTVFNRTFAKNDYPMRCVQTARFGYIYNAWSDGQTVFKNESQSGLTFNAMKRAAASDPAVAARVELFVHRVPEELYNFEDDPDALHNLASDPAYSRTLRALRSELLGVMESSDDPLVDAFRKHLASVR